MLMDGPRVLNIRADEEEVEGEERKSVDVDDDGDGVQKFFALLKRALPVSGAAAKSSSTSSGQLGWQKVKT